MKSAHNRYRKPARENPTDSPPIVVGQTLYREYARRGRETEILEVTVGRIGRKYFYLSGRDDTDGYDLETLRYIDKNYSQHSSQLYRTKQEILDRNEKNDLLDMLQKHFNWCGKCKHNTLEQLREVAKAAGIDVKEST